MTLVRNRAIDSLPREATAWRPRLAGGDYVGPDPAGRLPEDDVIARSEADALRARLQQLPDAQAEVIALAYYGELTHREIATSLCVPQGTVMGRMRLGLKKLREQIDSTG